MNHKAWGLGVALGLAGLGAGFGLGVALRPDPLDRVVAVRWGDGKYGEAFYGTEVVLEPRKGGGFSVKARVRVGRGNGVEHACGELGVATTEAEAVKKWGEIQFRPDGLHIGDYFLAREKLESGR